MKRAALIAVLLLSTMCASSAQRFVVLLPPTAIGIPTLILGPPSTSINSGTASAGTSVDAPAGSLIVVALDAATLTDSISRLIDSAGNPYSRAIAQNGTNDNAELWFCSNTTHDLPLGGTFTATTTNGGKWFPSGIAFVTGVNGGLDATNTFTSASAATYSLATGTLGTAKEIVFGLNATSDFLNSYVEGANFIELTGRPSDNNSGGDFAFALVSSTAGITWSPSWSSGGSLDVSAVIAAFKATPSAPVTIPSNYFGMTINGPIESGLTWPVWSPTTFRILDQFASADPTLFVPDWATTEPSNGSFTWTLWDALWPKYVAEDVTSLIVGFQSIPSWAISGGVTNASAVSAFVTAYLTRAALDGLPVKYVEGYNEPNLTYPNSVADLVSVQAAMYSAAKAYDPTITVTAPPINSAGAVGYLQNFLAAGGGAYFDVLGYHAYPGGTVVAGVGVDPEQIIADIASLQSTMAAAGINKPIWITEYNANAGSTPTPAQNATFLSITSLLAWSLGVQRQYWYAYDNNSGFGQMWTSGGGLNAAGVAWQQVVNWMIGAVMTPPCSLSGVVWTCGLTRTAGYQATAVWTSDGSTPSFNVPSGAIQYRDLAGVTHTGLGATVTIGRNPILLEN